MPPLNPSSTLVLTYRDLLRSLRTQRGPTSSDASASTSASTPSPADAATASAAASAAALARVRARVAAYAAARASASETGRALARLTARAGAKRRAWAAARARRVEALRADLAAAATAVGSGGLLEDARAVAREMKAAAKERLRGAVGGGGSDAGAGRHASAGPASNLASLSPSDAALLGSDGLGRALVTRGLAGICRAFMSSATDVTITGAAAGLAAALAARPPGQALLTVSNHASALDDPLVVSALLPPGLEADPRRLRWTLCATDRCFTNPAAAAFFRAGKVLPVERGAGLAQPGMRVAEALLGRGDWVHVFPEGTRSKDGRVRPARKGVGRLAVAAARAAATSGAPPPLLLPFAHTGMLGVTPPGAVIPRPGGVVRIAVGEPISVADVEAAHAAAGAPGGEGGLYLAVASAVGRSLASLHAGLVAAEGVAVLDTPAASWAVDSDVLMPLLAAEEAAAAPPAWPAAAAGGAGGRAGWRLAATWPAMAAAAATPAPAVAAAPALPSRSPRRARAVGGLAAAAVAATQAQPPLPPPVPAPTTAPADLMRALRGGGGGPGPPVAAGPLTVTAAFARARAAAAVLSWGEGSGAGGDARRRLAFG